jgi:hypothetical protein
MQTRERTVHVNDALYRRANRKLHRYGHSLDGAVTIALQLMLSRRGDPLENLDLEFANAEDAIAYLHDYVQSRS